MRERWQRCSDSRQPHKRDCDEGGHDAKTGRTLVQNDSPVPVNRILALRRRLFRPERTAVFYDPRYRLPLAGLESATGLDLRRADYAVWYLVQSRAVLPSQLRAPERISYAELLRVHRAEYLETLSDASTWARIFAVDPSDV